MPKVPMYTLAWSPVTAAYELYLTRDREALRIVPDSPTWFAWLEQVSSFAFLGKNGHCTARKEARQRGDRYWSAYLAMGEHLTKKYLGKSADLTLDTLAQVAQQRHFPPRLGTQEAAVRAQLELAQGNVATAIRWADNSGLSANDDDLRYPRESEYLALARVRIAQARDDPASPFLQDVLHLLNRLLRDAEAKARMNSALEILVLRALALEVQGERTGALSTLERALVLAEPEGYIRLFVDEGEPILALLRQAYARGIVSDYVATLLSESGEQHAPTLPPSSPRSGLLLEPLTEREGEVLRLLLEGASNREIARRLVLSVNTVKRHVYNLCGKLSVQSRTQAIARARTLNLL
jgi:ATP/maltotriose-dependent transcriptional regulator MalT